MELNLNWSRKGMDRLAEHIREDGELSETPALMLLDMVATLRAKLAEVEQERNAARNEAAEALAAGVIWMKRAEAAEHARDYLKQCEAVLDIDIEALEQGRDRLAAEVERLKHPVTKFGLRRLGLDRLRAEVEKLKKVYNHLFDACAQEINRAEQAETTLTAAQEENKRLEEQNADLLAALQIVKEQRQLWWGKAVHRGRELSAAQQSAQERDILGQAIGEAVVKAGISEEVAMTGPELLLMLDGLVMQAQSAQEQYRKGMERAAEIADELDNDVRISNSWTVATKIRAELSKGEVNE